MDIYDLKTAEIHSDYIILNDVEAKKLNEYLTENINPIIYKKELLLD